jgi:hypothetical protein
MQGLLGLLHSMSAMGLIMVSIVMVQAVLQVRGDSDEQSCAYDEQWCLGQYRVTVPITQYFPFGHSISSAWHSGPCEVLQHHTLLGTFHVLKDVALCAHVMQYSSPAQYSLVLVVMVEENLT